MEGSCVPGVEPFSTPKVSIGNQKWFSYGDKAFFSRSVTFFVSPQVRGLVYILTCTAPSMLKYSALSNMSAYKQYMSNSGAHSNTDNLWGDIKHVLHAFQPPETFIFSTPFKCNLTPVSFLLCIAKIFAFFSLTHKFISSTFFAAKAEMATRCGCNLFLLPW